MGRQMEEVARWAIGISMLIVDVLSAKAVDRFCVRVWRCRSARAQPFRIEKIRAGRQKPGLMRQHLTAVRAATHDQRGYG